MKIILYSIGCPQCKVLERKLDSYHAVYELCTDEEVMKAKGFKTAPILGLIEEINGETKETYLPFSKAYAWCKENLKQE